MNAYFRTSFQILKKYKWRSVFIEYFKKTFLFTIIPFFIIIVLVSGYIYNTNKTRLISSSSESLKKNIESVEDIFTAIDKKVYALQTDNYILSGITAKEVYNSTDRMLNIVMRIEEQLHDFAITEEHIGSLFIYSFHNNTVFSPGQCNYKDWLERYHRLGTPDFFVSYKENNEYILQVSYGISVYSQLYGAVVFNINLDKYFDDYITENEDFYLIDNRNQAIFYSTNEKYIGTPAKNHSQLSSIENSENYVQSISGETLYISKDINDYIIAVSSIKSENNIITPFMCVIIVFTVILALSISTLFSILICIQFYKTFTPIMSLFKSENELDMSKNELDYIQNNISKIISQNEDIELELQNKIFMLKKMQTIALESQINPHFLLNTLNLINLKILRITKDDVDVTNCINDLSDMLKTSLYSNKIIISIREEIDYTKKYISILLTRYNHNFDVEWNIDEDILEFNTLKFILQPVIENSLEHGLLNLPVDIRGKIRINAQNQNNSIVFEITDNGVGMSPDTVDNLMKNINADFELRSNHIGLKNINQRIKLIFGAQYGVSIKSQPKNGTTIQISIPATTNTPI